MTVLGAMGTPSSVVWTRILQYVGRQLRGTTRLSRDSCSIPAGRPGGEERNQATRLRLPFRGTPM